MTLLVSFAVALLVYVTLLAPLVSAAYGRWQRARAELDRVGRVTYPSSQTPGFGPRPTRPPARRDPSPTRRRPAS